MECVIEVRCIDTRHMFGRDKFVGWRSAPDISTPPTHGRDYEDTPEMRETMVRDIADYLRRELGLEDSPCP